MTRSGVNGSVVALHGQGHCGKTTLLMAAALTDGYHLAFWIACALVIGATAVGAVILRPQRSRQPAPQPAQQPARELVQAGQAS